MLQLIGPFGVNLFESLIVWKNPFGVDIPRTEKPKFQKQKLKTVAEENLQ